MIKYLGSKRSLIPDLLGLAENFPELRSITDLFSGTARVGHAFKRQGYAVHSNDLNAYAHVLASCYVEADREKVEHDARLLIEEFSKLQGSPGYFTKTFCEDARFFQPHNGERIDAIREAIARKDLDPLLESVLLVSLMEAADRVDSTCGLQMAYVKKWAQRSFRELELRMPDVVPAAANGSCRATREDAVVASAEIDTDIVYLDPPYNQHSYLSNYHIWETLVLWDRPEHYGIARKRVDCRERKSAFNSRASHVAAFEAVVENAARASLVIVSFSDEGFQARPALEALLRRFGDVHVVGKEFRRYVGAKIGIHSPAGERVGAVSHLRNEEHIYLLAPHGAPKSDITRRRLEALASTTKESSETFIEAGARALSESEEAILAILGANGQLGPREVERLSGLSNYRVATDLRRLVGLGAVVASGNERKVYASAALGSDGKQSVCELGADSGS